MDHSAFIRSAWSTVRSATAIRCLSPSRTESTPGRMLPRTWLRSSPVTTAETSSRTCSRMYSSSVAMVMARSLAGGAPQPGREPRVGRVVVGAGHREHRVAAPPPGRHLRVLAERAPDLVGHQQDVEAVVVAVEEELGAHLGAVGSAPAEGVAVDGAGNTAPQRRVLDAGARQDLRHLRDVAEHVRQVADGHRAAEVRRGRPSHLQVAHDGLAGAEELVEQDQPRPDGEPAARRPGPRRGRGSPAASPGSPRSRPSARRR